MKEDKLLLLFSGNKKLWEDKFEVLIDMMINYTESNNMHTCELRFKQCKQRIIDLLVTGSGQDK